MFFQLDSSGVSSLRLQSNHQNQRSHQYPNDSWRKAENFRYWRNSNSDWSEKSIRTARRCWNAGINGRRKYLDFNKRQNRLEQVSDWYGNFLKFWNSESLKVKWNTKRLNVSNFLIFYKGLTQFLDNFVFIFLVLLCNVDSSHLTLVGLIQKRNKLNRISVNFPLDSTWFLQFLVETRL